MNPLIVYQYLLHGKIEPKQHPDLHGDWVREINLKLIASGQSAQITYHLNRAMNNGLTAEEAGELIAQTAFYAGWPNAFSASAVVGEVLRNRPK